MEDIYNDFQNDTHIFYLCYKNAIGHYTMPSNHFHDRFEIFYLLSGERYYFIKDRTLFIKKGDLVLINNYELHKTIDTGVPNHERILIKFGMEFVNTLNNNSMEEIMRSLFSVNLIHFSIKSQTMVEDILQKMLQEIDLKRTGFEISLQSLLMQLLVFSARYIENNPTHIPEHPTPIHQKVSEIAQYINQHYAEQISLSSISKSFFMSPYYLSRAFNKVTGFTFIEYLNNVRIKEAQKLLRESRLSASSIAEKVGFGSIAHFGRVFKTITDQSPLHYRKISRL
jgi:YesN/AraC family two-component response regulator